MLFLISVVCISIFFGGCVSSNYDFSEPNSTQDGALGEDNSGKELGDGFSGSGEGTEIEIPDSSQSESDESSDNELPIIRG